MGRHVSPDSLLRMIGHQIGPGGLVASGAPLLNPALDPGDGR